MVNDGVERGLLALQHIQERLAIVIEFVRLKLLAAKLTRVSVLIVAEYTMELFIVVFGGVNAFNVSLKLQLAVLSLEVHQAALEAHDLLARA